MMRRTSLLVVTLGLAACGGGSSSPISPGTSGVTVLVVFTPAAGTYMATINNQTFTAAGGFTLTLPAGTHEISGSFRAAAFGIGFGSVGGGGAETSSLRSLVGPSPSVSACQALYFNENTPTVNREFRLQFRVTASVGSACQGAF
jgi:hypothetical protein